MPDGRAPGVGNPGGLPAGSETVITIGTFDGVHRGHQAVLARLRDRGREAGLRSVMVTFEPHPLEVVNPAAARPLLTVGEEKLEVLAESGIDYCVVMPFTAALARYSADQFIGLLCERLHLREMVSGYDNGFGRGREGDVEAVRAIGLRRGFPVEVVPPTTTDDGRPISSTSIRRAIAGGDLRSAAEGLGRPYAVCGTVVRGEQRGRTLGYPTLNLPLPGPRKLLPPEGVYAVRVQTPDGPFGGMLNLGPRPTFGDARVMLEAHLLDATGAWYGAHVRVEFVSRLRDVRKFDGAEALVAQLRRDEEQARRALTLP
jgi:riboflavin kinase/FMN adenylyltransferase